MSPQWKYKPMAAFLLAVFSLNTVAGFACSVGMNLGQAAKPHHEAIRQTAEPKKHAGHCGSASCRRSTDTGKKQGHCCNDEVTSLIQTDKSVPRSLLGNHPAPAISVFEPTYQTASIGTDLSRDTERFVRNYHPPIPDIRIAICSFLI